MHISGAKFTSQSYSHVIWDGHTIPFDCWFNIPPTGMIMGDMKSYVFKDQSLLAVFVSGVMMCSNPQAGVSVARSIRSGAKEAAIIAIDDKYCPYCASGISDPVFDNSLYFEFRESTRAIPEDEITFVAQASIWHLQTLHHQISLQII